MTKIKICGLSRFEDIEYVNKAMPDYVGFVFADSKRKVSFGEAKKLSERLNKSIIPVGVFVDEHIENILKLLDAGIISMAQLHGKEDEEYISKLKKKAGCKIIKAVSVESKNDLESGKNSSADILLFDKGKGGTGIPFDWSIIEENLPKFFLAGGLNCGNVISAIKKTKPYGVDISSGVETDGKKDLKKIEEIVRRIRNE